MAMLSDPSLPGTVTVTVTATVMSRLCLCHMISVVRVSAWPAQWQGAVLMHLDRDDMRQASCSWEIYLAPGGRARERMMATGDRRNTRWISGPHDVIGRTIEMIIETSREGDR